MKLTDWSGNWNWATSGTDPEIFVRSGMDLLPAYEFLPSKKEPVYCCAGKVPANIFWDGFQAEFSTTSSPCIAYVVDSIKSGLQGVLEKARVSNPTAKLTAQNVFQIPVATLRSAKDEHVILGCDPSQNAYYISGEHVSDGRQLRYRFAGGHIHLGLAGYLKSLSQETAEKYVKALDMILGVWAVGAAANIDNPIRRKYYGLAGEYRLPQHGLEYRTLSNFWYVHPGISNLVLMLARAIIGFSQADLEENWVAHVQETVETINNHDVSTARKILAQNELVLRKIFSSAIYRHPNAIQSDVVEQAIKIGQSGVESVVADVEDFEKNWKIGKGWVGHAEGEMESWNHLSKKTWNALAA